MARKTKKLVGACEVLAQERFCDTYEEYIIEAVKANKITVEQVYKTCRHFGYRWNGKKWSLKYPAWYISS